MVDGESFLLRNAVQYHYLIRTPDLVLKKGPVFFHQWFMVDQWVIHVFLVNRIDKMVNQSTVMAHLTRLGASYNVLMIENDAYRIL